MRKHRTFSPEFKLRVVMKVVTVMKHSSEMCRERRDYANTREQI